MLATLYMSFLKSHLKVIYYKYILLCCANSNGCGRTGTFISIYVTLERIKTDGTVDIFQVVKSSRLRRTKLVANCVSDKPNNTII